MSKDYGYTQFIQLSYRYQQAILDILVNFDFVKIQKIMEQIGWEYHDGVPDVERLVNTAKELLSKVAYIAQTKREENFCGTGGFRANYYLAEDTLSLEFILEDYEAELAGYVD